MSSSTSCAIAATASPPEPATTPAAATWPWPGTLATAGALGALTALSQLLLVTTGMAASVAAGILSLGLLVTIGAWIALIDFREHRIPNRLVLVLGSGLAGANLANPVPALIGAASLAGVYLVLHLVASMGFGDVKLATICGLALGPHGPETAIIGFCAGYFCALPAAVTHALGKKAGYIAFGPWILCGVIVALTWALLR